MQEGPLEAGKGRTKYKRKGEKLNEGCSDKPGSSLTEQVEFNQVKQGEMTFWKRK